MKELEEELNDHNEREQEEKANEVRMAREKKLRMESYENQVKTISLSLIS